MKFLAKRVFDFTLSVFGLILLSPIFAVISFVILLDSKGGVFYKQIRVGRNGRDFELFKFRTMKVGSDQKGLITIGSNDSRITRVGLFLRKYKIDEFPQLFNVVVGNMSLVGPRPEVRKYVGMYTKEQMRVLSIKPGITDYASIKFRNENELLGSVDNPNEFYIKDILPAKLELNLTYIENMSLLSDLKIIFLTLKNILF